MIKCYKDMRVTADRTGWGTEEIHHKEQELSWDSSLTVKDHILKKCPWFYEFEISFTNIPALTHLLSSNPGNHLGAKVSQ